MRELIKINIWIILIKNLKIKMETMRIERITYEFKEIKMSVLGGRLTYGKNISKGNDTSE